MSKIKELEQLLTPLLEKELVELVDLQYVSEAGNKVLRLFVDKEGGIKLSDCEYLSNKVGECLDAANLIPDSYVLEVSSPGLDRILKNEKDFVKFLGKKARVTTYVPVNGQKNFLGIIDSCAGDKLVRPVVLSISYLLFEPFGISMITLISFGILSPRGTSCQRFI